MTAITVNLTDAQVQGLQAELADYNASQPEGSIPVILEVFVGLLMASRGDAAAQRYGTIPVFAFVSRFDPQKYAAIVAAAPNDKGIQALFAQLDTAEGGMVRLWKDSVKQGLGYLKSKGFINDADIAVITKIG